MTDLMEHAEGNSSCAEQEETELVSAMFEALLSLPHVPPEVFLPLRGCGIEQHPALEVRYLLR